MVDPISPNDAVAEEDEKKRRRRLILFWLFFGSIVVIIVLVFGLFRSDDNSVAAPTTSTTLTQTTVATTAAAPTTNPTQAPERATTTTEPPTVEGVWAVSVDVSVATGACAGEEEDDFEPDQVTIRQEGTVLAVVGLGFPKDTQVWEGKIEGNVVSFGGIREEDDGTTTALFIMEVDFATMTMTGKEEWTWEGPGGTCPNSESVVNAIRREP